MPQEEAMPGWFGEEGLPDLPVWKDLVARMGLKEARRILRCGLLAGQLPECNPEN